MIHCPPFMGISVRRCSKVDDAREGASPKNIYGSQGCLLTRLDKPSREERKKTAYMLTQE